MPFEGGQGRRVFLARRGLFHPCPHKKTMSGPYGGNPGRSLDTKGIECLEKNRYCRLALPQGGDFVKGPRFSGAQTADKTLERLPAPHPRQGIQFPAPHCLLSVCFSGAIPVTSGEDHVCIRFKTLRPSSCAAGCMRVGGIRLRNPLFLL